MMAASDITVNAHEPSAGPANGTRLRRMVLVVALSPSNTPRPKNSPDVAGIVTDTPPGVASGAGSGNATAANPVAAERRGAMLAVAMR
jgi:hypothetical protein